MPTQWIDIVDSAVKIGLGAFISSFATYMVTKLKSKKEAEKESKAVHREMVILAVNKTDEYFQFISEYVSRLYGIRDSFDKLEKQDEEWLKESIAFIQVVENKLLSARNGIVVAQSRLRLLSMSEAIDALDDVRKLETELRTFYLKRREKTEPPSRQFLDNLSTYFNKHKNRFHTIVSSHFLAKCC